MTRFDSALTALIANLTDREKRILRSRFGVDVSAAASDQEILEAMCNIERDVVEQVEEEALDALKRKN